MAALTDAALILLGGAANTREPGALAGSGAELGTADALDCLRRAADAGARLSVLAGGEPLSRRDLPALLEGALRAGLMPGMCTNGRMLLYDKVRRLLLARRTAYLRLALHGASARTHDAIVRVPGAFEQTLGGLRAMLREGEPGLRIDVACTLTRENAGELDALVDLVTALPRNATLGVRLVAPLATLEEARWADASLVAERIPRALERAMAAGAGILASWEGFAPCLLDRVAPLRDEVLRYGAPVLGAREAGAAIPLEATGDRAHPYPCQDCVHEARCPGAPLALLARDGESALRPTRSVRANSFNFEVTRELGALRIEAGACDVPARAAGTEPCRALVLVRGGEGALYESPTSDFTDAEITRIKDELGQLYLDLDRDATLFDFVGSIRRVRLHEACEACAERPRCPSAFVVDEDQPFAREERWLRKEVSRMRGRVLDVGCGEQPYRDEVAALIRDGHIDYHGLDPDGAALERIRAAGMGGTLHELGIEDFEWEPGYFDYVLGLRSLNHFRDMERAFAVIARLMRVEGQLVLCDSPPFGMLRTRAQVRAADHNAPVGHEHFRNWTSQQVVEFLKRFPFRVDVHRPVSRKTSNQWIVKLMRVRDATERPAMETRA